MIEPIGDHSFRVVGEVDADTVGELVPVLDRACRLSATVELDMSGVTFLDSTGLHSLVNACRRLDEGGSMVLIRPSDAVRRVLELSKIQEVLPNLEIRD